MRKGVKIYGWFDVLDPRTLANGTMTAGMWLPSLLIWVERLRNIRRDREPADRRAWDCEFLPQDAYLWVPYGLSRRSSRFLSRFSWHPWWGIWDGLVNRALSKIPERLTLIQGTKLKGNWSRVLFFYHRQPKALLVPSGHFGIVCQHQRKLISMWPSPPAIRWSADGFLYWSTRRRRRQHTACHRST